MSKEDNARWNKWSFTLFGRETAAETFLYESINRTHPLFPD